MVNPLNPVTVFGVAADGTITAMLLDSTGLPFSRTGNVNPVLGIRATVTENCNTATGVDLFTVTGKVLVTMWTGEVTNALGTQIVDYKLRIKTDNVDLFTATNIASAAVGYMWSMPADSTLTLLTGSGQAVSKVKNTDQKGPGMANRVIGLAGGSLIIQSLRTAGDLGDAMIHTLWYWPLEASATVVAI